MSACLEFSRLKDRYSQKGQPASLRMLAHLLLIPELSCCWVHFSDVIHRAPRQLEPAGTDKSHRLWFWH
ncbi:hypothetical protein Y1Q_0021648 [Alligator mississippiensis]|uniref:Uncharacterized protein n=1 Tax=Alligator mississippiensis TaxID=8496 RepID=A0A151PAE8_ALLMI|nr:hypothetical protein Y1Q_0021648 [Alligator mississippiensis]